MKLSRPYTDREGTVIYAVLNDAGNSLGEIWKLTPHIWRNDRTENKTNYKTRKLAAEALMK